MVSVVLGGLDPFGVEMKSVNQHVKGGGTAVDAAAETRISDSRSIGVNSRCKKGYCTYDPAHANKREYVAFSSLKKEHLEYREIMVGFKSTYMVMENVLDPTKQIPVDDPLIVTQFNM